MTTSSAVVGSSDSSSTGGGGQGGAPSGTLLPPPAKLFACADTDRNGVIDAADLDGRSVFSWKRGAFVLANVDDDDGNGLPDADDELSTGSDLEDLARIRIELGSEVLAQAGSVTVEVITGGDNVRVMRFVGATAVPVVGPLPVAGALELGMHARRFAGEGWYGEARVVLRAYSKSADELASDEVAVHVAPMLLLPSSAVPSALHVATGPFANASFVSDLGSAAAKAQTTVLPPYATTKVAEMWMQDTVEIGYTQLPAHPPMHVALRANRGSDSYARTLRGPGMGYIEVGAPRAVPTPDAAIDGYGNLEVSPPVPGWPLGRIYYGQDTDTGVALHPEVVGFFKAQEVQAPFWIDVSWLASKHVDELLTFVTDTSKHPRLLVASPSEAGKLHPLVYGPYSKSIQYKVDTALNGGTYVIDGKSTAEEGVLKRLGLTQNDVVPLPVYFTAGRPDWANPVNGVFLGAAVYVAGSAGVTDVERKATSDRIAPLGMSVRWLDDSAYDAVGGNTHTATNATRVPVVADFTQALPSMP
jgi:protein-arginine deiminase